MTTARSQETGARSQENGLAAAFRRERMIDALAQAFAIEEGFFLTEADARKRGVRWPTAAQRRCNPGNVRRWSNDGKPYPIDRGYVDFLALTGVPKTAREEGWRVLKVVLGQYIDGQYHDGVPPTLYQICEKYAPAADANHPRQYADHVAARVGIRPDVPVASYILQEAA